MTALWHRDHHPVDLDDFAVWHGIVIGVTMGLLFWCFAVGLWWMLK